MADMTKYYDVITGPGVYRTDGGNTVRIVGFDHVWADGMNPPDDPEPYYNIHVWLDDADDKWCPNGKSCDRQDVITRPESPEPREDETWYVQFPPGSFDGVPDCAVFSAMIQDVTRHTVLLTLTPGDEGVRFRRDALTFVERET